MAPIPVSQQQSLVERLLTACGGAYKPEQRRKYFVTGPQTHTFVIAPVLLNHLNPLIAIPVPGMTFVRP